MSITIRVRMSIHADPNKYFSLSTWILKSLTIRTLYAASTNSDRKSANSLIKPLWCPGGLYTVASTKITGDLSLTLVSLDIYMEHHYFERIILETRPLRNTENIARNCSNTSLFTFLDVVHVCNSNLWV